MAPQTHIPPHPTCQQRCFWIPSMDVFEMHDAKNCTVLTWRPKHAYLCTKYASNSVFGTLYGVCLKCTMPKIVGFRRGAPNTHTSAANMPATGFLESYYRPSTLYLRKYIIASLTVEKKFAGKKRKKIINSWPDQLRKNGICTN